MPPYSRRHRPAGASGRRPAGCLGCWLCRGWCGSLATVTDRCGCRGAGRNTRPALPPASPLPAPQPRGQALEAALELVVGELRAGAHPVRAFSIAADETGGPVAVALRAVAARARLGADVTAGLLAAARSSALPAYWERLAVCWQLGSDHGLAIASLMRAAQRDVAERQRFSARVSAGMAGARASAAILAILPLLGVLLGQLIGARPLSFLLTGRVGGWLLVVGLTLACAGLLWSDRITDRPVL